jgi:hypothetical protein
MGGDMHWPQKMRGFAPLLPTLDLHICLAKGRLMVALFSLHSRLVDNA